ncbi:MAG: glycoside hydrolase family 16 protein, partial [Chloroflexota bacterium]|nr:glycoside hydrolase family 16 protein [Chloroflexota bacterium]
SFSGYDWAVKSSDGARVGPGGNLYSDAADAVWVDGDGALHLTIRRHRETWHCSEVVAVTPFGFGRYRFRVQGELTFDQNVVAAMFLYLDDRHEIDIELARFGSAADPANAQFAVQPPDRHSDGFLHRFALEPGWRPLIHEIEWRPDVVHFRCLTVAGDVMVEASTRRPVPHGALASRINLWLYAGGGE